jgi:hypothetical protein
MIVKQEASIPLSFLYISFELDTCSLHDVIVMVCVRERVALLSIRENKCTIIAPMKKKKREDTRISTQTDPSLIYFAL